MGGTFQRVHILAEGLLFFGHYEVEGMFEVFVNVVYTLALPI